MGADGAVAAGAVTMGAGGNVSSVFPKASLGAISLVMVVCGIVGVVIEKKPNPVTPKIAKNKMR